MNGVTPAAGGNTAAQFANLEPAAGGTSADDLAAIEPAAGGEEVTCWGDAMSAAGAGGAARFNFGGTLEDSLVGALACSTGGI